MKNLLIFIVIFLGVWQFFLKDNANVESVNKKAISKIVNSDALQTLAKAKEIAKPKAIFKCDGRQHCSQMTSCSEATFFIKNCPETKMDGDFDGVPCEQQWCN